MKGKRHTTDSTVTWKRLHSVHAFEIRLVQIENEVLIVGIEELVAEQQIVLNAGGKRSKENKE